MDSQLASVLTSGSLEVQNGSQHGEASGPVTEDVLDPKDKTSPRTKPGNLKSCAVKAAGTIRQDAQSINGKKPEVGGTSKPAFQEVRDIGGLKQPITVKTGVPVLHRQPIRIKIVVPPGCKRPITNSATSPTKDCAASYMKGPVLVSVGALIPETNSCHTQISAAKNEEVREETSEKTDEETDAKSFQDTEAEGRDRKVWDVKITHRDASETHFLSDAHAVHVSSHQRVKEETTDREIEQNIPQTLPEVKLKFHKTFCEVEAEEQTEPLDLSFPKKSRERSSGRFLGDPGCESPLIMEVDEYEGDGDRDLVEEDSDENSGLRLSGIDLLEESLLSPSFFSTSVLASLSSEDCDTEDLLLIDDQGIPYTLSPDGLKVPQVNASAPETPQPDQGNSAEQEVTLSSHLATLAGVSQSLDHALAAPCGEFDPSSVPAGDLSLKGGDQITTPEIFPCLMTNTDPSELNIKAAQEANVVLSPSSGLSLPAQPFQILTNPPTNAPILLLSSSSSAPAGLSLPLSVTQTSPGASTPVLLLLSPVSSSPDDSTSTSTPIAVLDPSTGQLSQITSASAPFSLPLSSGQVSVLGSSRPTIRLSPSSSPLILSGLNNVTSGPALTSLAVPSSTFALQDNHLSTATLIQTQISYSESNPGTEAISVEESENKKPSTFATTSSQTQTVTYDTLTLPTSEAEAQSPASESRLDFSDVHSEHLPLDDHLYFSNSAAPPSPPIGPLLPSGKLDSLEALEPLSPAESPTSLGSRRVLCCHLCPRIFFYLSDLERHAITHSQKKPHVCQQCGKAFKRSSHLQRHKHIHTGQRNFVCPICSKRFREAGELQRHQRVHTGEKPYQCQLCHTRFAERNTLRRHTKRKHPYHQVAMEMLNERKDRGGARGDGGDGGRGGVPEEESAEWYSSTVSTLDNSESETET